MKLTETETTFEEIYSSTFHPRYYGQKYLDTKSEDELFLLLGEACCLSAFSLVNIFKLPKIGRLILSIIKYFSPQRYQHYRFLYSYSFSHCLMFICIKLKNILKMELSEEEAERISSTAFALGGSYLGVISNFYEEDKKQLLKEMEHRLFEYTNYDSVDGKLLLEHIFIGLGRKISPKQVVIFLRETIEKDPLYIVEPFRFINKFLELKS